MMPRQTTEMLADSMFRMFNPKKSRKESVAYENGLTENNKQ